MAHCNCCTVHSPPSPLLSSPARLDKIILSGNDVYSSGGCPLPRGAWRCGCRTVCTEAPCLNPKTQAAAARCRVGVALRLLGGLPMKPWFMKPSRSGACGADRKERQDRKESQDQEECPDRKECSSSALSDEANAHTQAHRATHQPGHRVKQGQQLCTLWYIILLDTYANHSARRNDTYVKLCPKKKWQLRDKVGPGWSRRRCCCWHPRTPLRPAAGWAGLQCHCLAPRRRAAVAKQGPWR